MFLSSSVGIIGGADGPTAVFIAGDPIGFIVMGVLVVTVIGFVVHWLLKR